MLRSVFATLVFACGFVQAGQILTNPDFESGSIAPWTDDHRFGTGVDWAITSTNCHSGSFCAVDTGNIGLEQTFSPIAVSSITDINFWILHPNASVHDLAVEFFYVGGGDDDFLLQTTGTGWNFLDVLTDLRASGSLDGFEIFGFIGQVTMVDDISITANAGVPEPSSYGLMLIGIGFLALMRKRLISALR